MIGAEKQIQGQIRRWWPVPILVGALLAVAVMFASASSTAPQAVELFREELSTKGWFAAYPDIAVGANGLVAVVWTEGASVNDKQNGPLKLAWTSNSVAGWSVITVDPQPVFGAAVATDGDTIHVVWSRNKTSLNHTTCTPGLDAQYSCAAAPPITTVSGEDTALQVDIVVDGNHNPHVVWVKEHDEGAKKTKRIYYARKEKESGSWLFKSTFTGQAYVDYDDSEGPALAYANNLIHLVWTEWQNDDHTDSTVEYARRDFDAGDWSPLDFETLADWTDDFRARNPSIAAAESNVYVAWDFLSIDDKDPISGNWRAKSYAVGYRHSANDGSTWPVDFRSYPQGSETGFSGSGTQIFKSSEGDTGLEWVHYLRPDIKLVTSGTDTVPVLAWHAQVSTGSSEPGLLSVNLETAYKVFWDYATGPGSDAQGYIAWTGTPITLTTDLCGNVDMSVDSTTGRLAPVGDLGAILAGETTNNHLHATYHEQTDPTSGFWQVLYNNYGNSFASCNYVYLPVLAKRAPFGEE